MKSTYKDDDVILLLKDITGIVEPLPAKIREKLIQNGTHYSEMLPLEYKPSSKYMEAYQSALTAYKEETALLVCRTAELIYNRKGHDVVLVSLARAGIPIGILIKHYIEAKYKVKIFHYSISIIRDKGIDNNALKYILKHHPPKYLQFIDGWIGKGAISNELKAALNEYKDISNELAVLSDPAGITNLCGTHEDMLIPSSCLNCTISGLISRTFYKAGIIGQDDFHGAAYYKELIDDDLSYAFINEIEKCFDFNTVSKMPEKITDGFDDVVKVAKYYNINNYHLIKPGIGEATRVLLRRIPWRLLIKEDAATNQSLAHLIQLAKEKNVPVEYYPLNSYLVCGIIKQMADT